MLKYSDKKIIMTGYCLKLWHPTKSPEGIHSQSVAAQTSELEFLSLIETA